MTNQDIEQTLPSVAAPVAPGYGLEVLTLTILFHPQVERIGQFAIVPRQDNATPWILGRNSPEFGAEEGARAPLHSAHVSRKAIQLDYFRRGLKMTRMEGSSRCRIPGEELVGEKHYDESALRRGVPLALSHNIVLLLQLGPVKAAAANNTAVPALRGTSQLMEDLRSRTVDAARHSADVLITGETGTGKELVAQALHQLSARQAGPMISVNMAAIPPELAGAALFGSEKGAYTGAQSSRAGYFEQAKGGSLFLDEIGDTPTAVQPQLLRALEQREIQSVGGPIKSIDVRVISATDVALEAPDSRFKAALRYRLGASEIAVPALREHPQDIGELLLHFLRQGARENPRENWIPGETNDELTLAAWANIFFQFAAYSWPGNVRQLRNFAQQLAVSTDAIPALTPAMYSAISAGRRPSDESVSSAGSAQAPRHAASPRRKMREIDDLAFSRAMHTEAFEVQRVARALGVSRGSVYRRIEESVEFRLANEVSTDEVEAALTQTEGDVGKAAALLKVSHSSLRTRLRGTRRQS